ncbi:uncharacterized protein LOC117540270 [Xyrichtys novacula]|uniref:Uncharacterized protein LOC117540270 n=1 Tax=Xyrichtys novacula TaxID=13765 RepID=A0AAV1F915_XYRNO|nr:uncharacterized protein LOC117540270 [Xyrichtys novacula]
MLAGVTTRWKQIVAYHYSGQHPPVRGLKIGHLGSWKPVQTGLVIATRVILEVQQDLLSKGHKFVLTSRFTQDCLENTFSFIRQRNPVPTPAEFHYVLRAVTVGQFLTTVPTGNYLDDGSDHLADFLDSKRSNCSPPPVVRLEQLDDPASPPDFTKIESCVLYHLARYIVKRVISWSLCEECQSSLTESENATDSSGPSLQQLRPAAGSSHQPTVSTPSQRQLRLSGAAAGGGEPREQPKNVNLMSRRRWIYPDLIHHQQTPVVLCHSQVQAAAATASSRIQRSSVHWPPLYY